MSRAPRSKVFPVTGSSGALILSACLSADPHAESAPDPSFRNFSPAVLAVGEELVYESLSLRSDSDGSVELISEVGEIDPDVWQRIARPWSYAQDAWLYHELAWQEPSDSGVLLGYRVTRTVNSTTYDESSGPGFVIVAPEVQVTQAALSDDAEIAVVIRLRDFPAWDVPVLPPDFALSISDYSELEASRSASLASRQELFDAIAEPLLGFLSDVGAVTHGMSGLGGWIAATVPVAAVEDLSLREDILYMGPYSIDGQLGAWALGDGRSASRMDSQQFLDAGYDGSRSNSARHGFSDLTVSVIETYTFEDEACFFYNGTGCPSGTHRIQERFRCDFSSGNRCLPISNFNDSDSDVEHATAVTSAILADYTKNQHLDGAVTRVPGVPVLEWEASGLAPGARAILFGQTGTSQQGGWADALDDSVDRSVDAANMSLGLQQSYWCHPVADQPVEIEAQIAHDDGILVVACAGNSNAIFGGCNVWSPGSLPKTLAVSSFDSSPSACQNDYKDSCVWGPPSSSATGGAPIRYAGYPVGNQLALVDLLGPTNPEYLTTGQGTYGTVAAPDALFSGCSYAAPQVTGLALVMKHALLAQGNVWVNSPGRLLTTMLAMGDRHRGSSVPTSQAATGVDNLSGLGKPKLRLNENSEFIIATHTFSSVADDYKFFISGTIAPIGTNFVKCTMFQEEDTGDPDDLLYGMPVMNYISLRVRVLRGGGINNVQCLSTSVQDFTRTDADIDTRRVVAIESSESVLQQRCFEVTMDPLYLAGSPVTAHAYCYFASEDDDET